MNKKTIGKIIMPVIFVSLLTGCQILKKESPERIGMILSQYELKEGAVLKELGDVIPTKGKKDGPKLIPGRLLVKIDPSETAEKFTIGEPDKECTLNRLHKYGLIPPIVNIINAVYIGLSQSGNAAFKLELEKPTNFKELKRIFAKSKLSLTNTFPPVGKNQLIKSVLAELKPELMPQYPGLLCETKFFQLKKKSVLNGIFRKIGVQSIRRVFRATERIDKNNPGYYHVVKISDLLDEIRQRFPQRTARAYPDVKVPPNMENWFLLRMQPEVDLGKAIILLKDIKGIQKVSADYPILTAQYPPQFPNQWGLKNTGQTGGTAGEDINIEQAWQDTAPSQQPVVVAVIDTGFKEDLDQLSGRLWTNPLEVPSNGYDDDCNGYIDDIHGMTAYDPNAIIYSGPPCTVSPGGPSEPFRDHGTMVAGVIAADHAITATANPDAIAGTAGTQDVRLINLVVGNCEVNSPLASGTSEMAESLYYAIDKGADIANISLIAYGYHPVLLEEAVNLSLANGLIIAASAGNDGHQYTKDFGTLNFAPYPATLRGVIAVGGVNHFGQWWPQSNYGPGLDLVAPAENIRTITYSDPTQTVAEYTDVNGTSLSAPFVTGTAAMILGKYPHVTAPYMRHWLRATARDVRDPLGIGADLEGEDIWTGAGILDAGTATVSLADPNDQPINVDLLVERLRDFHYSHYVADAVAGSPDLGITVTTPDYCIEAGGNNRCLNNWRLEYGVGDAPSVWFPLSILDPSITTNTIDVERTGSSYFRKTEVASGANYLNTDLLNNNLLYTIKLVAESNANPPRKFVAYDWVIPTRAKVFYPLRNTPIVGRWGWKSLWGFVDIRDNANYQISFNRDDGSMLWNGSLFFPAQRYSDPYWDGEAIKQEWGTSASAFMELMGSYSKNGSVQLFPSGTNPENYEEGWVNFTLNVQAYTGANLSDEVSLYLDNSHFPYETNWPQDVETDAWRTGYSQESVFVTDMGGTIGPRIFIHSRKRFLCYSPDGTLLWDKSYIHRNFTDESSSGMGNRYDLPDFAVEDVNNDGIKEIVVAGSTHNPAGGTKLTIQLLNYDGSIFSNWPREFSPYDDYSKIQYINKIHVADITGDSDKEIIFYRKPLYYYGIPEEDIMPGVLHVVGLDAQDIWTKQYPPEQRNLPIQVGDIDNDGKEEILLEPDRILEGNGTFKPGWDTELNPGFRSRLVDLDLSTPELEVLMYRSRWTTNYEVRVLNSDGTEATGWPVNFISDITYEWGNQPPFFPIVTVGQVIPGGNPEVIVCDDKIRVRSSGGQPIVSLPDIDLSGICNGISLADRDNDGSPDIYFALVKRMQYYAPDTSRRGIFLEAYELDGTRLADTDNLWPIIVDGEFFKKTDYRMNAYWNGSVTIGDIDGDNSYEAIHLYRLRKSYRPTGGDDTRIEVLDIQ